MPRRTRLTITLREDLLRAIDKQINAAEIRNRSHAIEVLLQRALGHGARQAVILAAGAGVRLRPFTYELPKPLLPVGGRPLLAHMLSLLRDHGIRELILVTGYLGERIERAFGQGENFGLEIRYVRQGQLQGTGSALLTARPALRSSPFLCLYGDILARLDLSELVRTHEAAPRAVGTIALTSVVDPSAYGAVRLQGLRVMEFREKPPKRAEVSRLVFAGVSVFSTDVFTFFPKRAAVSLERDVFPALVARGALCGYPFDGPWFDVSTTAAYERALKVWSQGKRPPGNSERPQ